MPGTIWTRWHWLDDGVLPLAAAVSYVSWAYPAFATYVRDAETGAPHPGFTFWLCLGTLLGGTVAGRWASRMQRGTMVVLAGALVAVLLSVSRVAPADLGPDGFWREASFRRMAVAVSVCTLLLWWRGVRLAHADHHEETSRTFTVGTVALAGLAIVGHFYGRPEAPGRSEMMIWLLLAAAVAAALALSALLFFARVDEQKLLSGGEVIFGFCVVLLSATLPAVPSPEALSGPILLFVFSGLVTQSLLGLSWVLNNQRARGGVRLRIDRGWLAVVLVVVAAIVGGGLLVGQVLTPRAVRSAMTWLSVLWIPLAVVLSFVLFTVVWVAMKAVVFLLARLAIRFPSLPDPPTEELENLERSLELPDAARQGITVLAVWVVLALIVWILIRAARQLRPRVGTVGSAAEHRRTVFSLDLLQEQLGDLLAALRARVPSPFVGLGPRRDARWAIRRAYRQILRRAISLGVPRESGQTPEAYAEALSARYPEERAPLETLTTAYDVARYGLDPLPPEQVQVAQDASARIDAGLPSRVKPRDRSLDE
jgi:uncharacterized protein DUF4129